MSAIINTRRFVTNASSSTNLVVDGSVTPVEYLVQPIANTIYTAYSIIFNAYGTGALNSPIDFWAGPALTNGLTSNIRSNGFTTPTLALVRNNFELIQFFGAEFLGKSLGPTTLIRGEFDLDPPLILNGNRGDFFRIVVNDNLTTYAIGQMTISMRGATTFFF